MTGRVQYWMVMLSALAWGAIQVVDVPTRQAFSIEMVGRDDLMNAIALNSAAWNGAAVVGPTVAGLLIAVIGVPLCFLVNGLSYIAVIVSLTLMRNLPSLVSDPDRQPLFQRMREGAHYLQRDPLVGGMLFVVAVFSLFAMNRLTLIPLFADGVLNAGAAGFGFLMAALGLGALTGGLSLVLIPHSASGRRQFWIGLLWAASLLAFSFSRSMPTSLALLFAAGVCQMWFLATANTRIQMATPDRLRGRVMAFYAQAMMGVGPLGATQAGVLASLFGAPSAMWAGAAACGLMIVAVRIFHREVFTLEPDDYRDTERKI